MTRPSPIRFRRLSLSVAYKSVLFPFDIFEFAQALQGENYLIHEAFDTAPSASRVEFSGPVERKGDVAITVNPEKHHLGVHARTPGTLVSELDLVEDILLKEFDMRSPNIAFYYELIANMLYAGRESPLVAVHRHFSLPSVASLWSDILGQPAGVFGIRLSPFEAPPNQPRWFDIKIEPWVPSPQKRYMIDLVYRSDDRNAVREFTASLEDNIRRGIAGLEREER
jgi:hypothetical protein